MKSPNTLLPSLPTSLIISFIISPVDASSRSIPTGVSGPEPRSFLDLFSSDFCLGNVFGGVCRFCSFNDWLLFSTRQSRLTSAFWSSHGLWLWWKWSNPCFCSWFPSINSGRGGLIPDVRPPLLSETQLKRSIFARRNVGFALLFKRLNVAIQKHTIQFSILGSRRSHTSPVGTNGTLMIASSGTPTFNTTSWIFFLNFRRRSSKNSCSVTPLLLGAGWTSLANVNATTACSQSCGPNASVSFWIVIISSFLIRRLLISVQKMNASKPVTFSLIFFRYTSSFPVPSANPGVSTIVTPTPFIEKL